MESLIAYVGTYSSATNASLLGGIHVCSLSSNGLNLTSLQHVTEPSEAGYIVYAEELSTLYAVNEKKTDGRGPVSAPAAIHAFGVNPATGELTAKGSQLSPGPNPTFLSYSAKHNALFSANHGAFDHIEKVVRSESGWTTQYVYDDSTIIRYGLAEDGTITGLHDVIVLTNHGTDPNTSPQVGGHSQASPHAHSATLDPSEKFLVAGDKGADCIYVYRIAKCALEAVYTFESGNTTGPRHIVWSQTASVTRFFATYELSSEVASFQFDTQTGQVQLLSVVSSVAATFTGYNEPAEIQLHPTNQQLLYVNNRGEDTVTWFKVDEAGQLSRVGSVQLGTSENAGVAARSFRFTPKGDILLVADRPAQAIRSYSVNIGDGDLKEIYQWPVSNPAFVCIAELKQKE